MNDSSPRFPVGTLVLYKPRQADNDNSGYIGKEALVTRHMHSKTRHTPLPLRDCLIKFSSGVTLLVPETDIVLPK